MLISGNIVINRVFLICSRFASLPFEISEKLRPNHKIPKTNLALPYDSFP